MQGVGAYQATRTASKFDNQGLYSSTIPKNILCIFLQDLQIGINTISDWLNHMV